MRYFSFASRCRIFNPVNTGRRNVSYKTRKNLIRVMSNAMAELAPEKVTESAAAKFNHCTTFGVSVIANGALGANSILAFRDNASYIFNCGEGMQRLSVEHGFKLYRTKTVFLTYHSWSSVVGIMGVCLALQTQGINQLVIYGPPHVRDLILGLRSFVILKRLTLKIITDVPNHKYDDSLIKVQFIPIYPVSTKNLHKTVSEVNISPVSDNSDESDDTGSPSPKRRCQSEARESNNTNDFYCLCYVCETPEFGMHLDVNKCLSLGVPYGPLMGMLKNKNDVKLQNGKVIHWEDVCLSQGKSEIFIVVDCPGEEHLDPLVNEPGFRPYQGSSENEKAAKVVYHFTGTEIMKTPKYQEWMSRFPSTTKHVILNASNRITDHVEPYRLQEKLNFIDPAIFPKLKEDNIPEVKDGFSGTYPKHVHVVANEDEEIRMKDNRLEVSSGLLHPDYLKQGLNLFEKVNEMSVVRGVSTFRWRVYPKLAHQYSHSFYLDRKSCVQEILDIENVREELEELKEWKKRWEASKEYEALPEYPKLLFLGTGSGAPHSLRNASAILMEFENGYFMLLDCGEGTYGQMLRFFGKDKVREIIKKLRLIFVSHQHADHHLGLLNLLNVRFEVLTECKREEYKPDGEFKDINHLLMILPPSVRDWINASNKFNDLLFDAKIIGSSVAVQSSNKLKRYTNNLGIKNLTTVTVPHSYESYAVTFVTSNGYRTTYSGDTMPSDNLVELGKDSDLLIHEATFENGLETMAKQKKHSTIDQALEIGKRMGAKFIMLTHFSQRYSHLPHLKTALPENAGVAFDNMMLTPRLLPFLTRLEPLLKKIFASKMDLLNAKTMKRAFKEERDTKQRAQMKI